MDDDERPDDLVAALTQRLCLELLNLLLIWRRRTPDQPLDDEFELVHAAVLKVLRNYAVRSALEDLDYERARAAAVRQLPVARRHVRLDSQRRNLANGFTQRPEVFLSRSDLVGDDEFLRETVHDCPTCRFSFHDVAVAASRVGGDSRDVVTRLRDDGLVGCSDALDATRSALGLLADRLRGTGHAQVAALLQAGGASVAHMEAPSELLAREDPGYELVEWSIDNPRPNTIQERDTCQ